MPEPGSICSTSTVSPSSTLRNPVPKKAMCPSRASRLGQLS
jgi:hypothetical protein